MLQQNLPANTANASTLLQKQDLTAAKNLTCPTCSFASNQCSCAGKQGLSSGLMDKNLMYGNQGFDATKQFATTGIASGNTGFKTTDYTSTTQTYSSGQNLASGKLLQGGMVSSQPLMCNNCNISLSSCNCQKNIAPIVNKTFEETLVVKHVEPVEVRKEVLQTEVKQHTNAPIVQTHVQGAIIKEQHQNVIHEHHKDIVIEKHKQIIHEEHQPVIHEIIQPVIHQKHVHEIHQPIIHQKEQQIILEKEKELIHESQKNLVDEKINPVVKHEHFEKPVVTTEVKAPIIQGMQQKETIFVKDTNIQQTQHLQSTGLAQDFNKMNLVQSSGLHTTGLSQGQHIHGTSGLPMTSTTTTTTHMHSGRHRSGSRSSSSSSEGEYYEDLDAEGRPIQKKRSLGQKIKGMFSRKNKHTTAEQNYS